MNEKRLPTETMEEFLARVRAPAPATEAEERCGSCAYFDPDRRVCKRHAPIARVFGTGGYVAQWPPVPADGWCGDYESVAPA